MTTKAFGGRSHPPVGLHARPSVKFNKLAKTFASPHRVRHRAGRSVDRCQEHRQGDGCQGAAGKPAPHSRRGRPTPTRPSPRWSALVERDFDEAEADAARLSSSAGRRRRASPRGRSSFLAGARCRRTPPANRRGSTGTSRRPSPYAIGATGADGPGWQAKPPKSLSSRWRCSRTTRWSSRPSTRSLPASRPPTAWSAAIAAQIADYEAADDDYFRARATDLSDLRDRGAPRSSPARPRRHCPKARCSPAKT